jgi:hypothetical protein
MEAEPIEAALESRGGGILELVCAVRGDAEVRDADPLQKVHRGLQSVRAPGLAIKSNLKLTAGICKAGDHGGLEIMLKVDSGANGPPVNEVSIAWILQ